jgi:hypothetical protein
MGIVSPINDKAVQVVEEMVEQLKVVLSDSSTHHLLALDAMRYVLQLQVSPLFSSAFHIVSLMCSHRFYLTSDLEWHDL